MSSDEEDERFFGLMPFRIIFGSKFIKEKIRDLSSFIPTLDK